MSGMASTDSGFARADMSPTGISQSLGLDDAAHDLAGPGLGHIVDEVDDLRIGHGTQDGPHVLGQVLLEISQWLQLPVLRITKATITSPLTSSGLPMTAASATLG